MRLSLRRDVRVLKGLVALAPQLRAHTASSASSIASAASRTRIIEPLPGELRMRSPKCEPRRAVLASKAVTEYEEEYCESASERVYCRRCALRIKSSPKRGEGTTHYHHSWRLPLFGASGCNPRENSSREPVSSEARNKSRQADVHSRGGRIQRRNEASAALPYSALIARACAGL